jgi:hypothetical protein
MLLDDLLIREREQHHSAAMMPSIATASAFKRERRFSLHTRIGVEADQRETLERLTAV